MSKQDDNQRKNGKKSPQSLERLPTAKKLGQLIESADPFEPQYKNKIRKKTEKADAKLKAFEKHHEQKEVWSTFLLWVLGVMIANQIITLWCAGFGLLDFTQYKWLLPTMLIQNLAQIIALAAIAVKSLFGGFK